MLLLPDEGGALNTVQLITSRLRRHLAYLAVLAKAIDASYVKTVNPRDRIRLSEVADLVATNRDVDVSTPLRRDAVKAARLLGFTRIVNVSGAKHYSGMKRREDA